jgi:hypothetical protein
MCKDNELIIELTLPQLHKSAEAAFPVTTKRQHATDELNVVAVKFIPHQNALMIKAAVKNQQGGKQYDTTILIDNVEYVNEDGPEVVTFTGSDGQDHHIKPIQSNSSQAKVRCNCLDLYWRFATWNFNQGSLLGTKPKPYRKKTNRPDANPQQKPGICKHLMKTIESLAQSNLLR